MIIKTAKFVTSAAKYQQCIVSDLPQIAVIGKSNVGKSSLINFLTNQPKLARTSKSPGRTRLINYFLINDGLEQEFLLTDLPGYGYAEVSFAEKKNWAELLDSYLSNEKQLKHVLFLVDFRHPPTKNDLEMYNYMFHFNLPFTAVATKADKVPKSQRHKKLIELASVLKLGTANIIPVSVTEKSGKQQLLTKIQQVLTTPELSPDTV